MRISYACIYQTLRTLLSRGHVRPADISHQRPRAFCMENVSLLVFNTYGISVVCNCIVRAVCDKISYIQCLYIHHLLYCKIVLGKECMDHGLHQLKDQSRTIASRRRRLWHSRLLYNWRLLFGQQLFFFVCLFVRSGR